MNSQNTSFEQNMARLEQIVAALEGGRCTLDESLGLFEEGTKLTAYCSKLLKEAEQKIIKLTAAEAGETDGVLSDRQGEDMGEELSE